MFQLVYTSAPSGLVPGRSGFCTVARHREIPERLVAALEKISVYEPPPEHGRTPIFSFRSIALGNENFGVISRYCDAGLDYTGRRNSLAHHLIFGGAEPAAFPPPAEIARRFSGWISLWNEPARFLSDGTTLPAALLNAETKLPAGEWQKISSDAGNASALCPSGMPAEIVISREGLDEETLLKLFAEASLLVRGGAWSVGWTTCIQKTDTTSHLHWRGVPAGAGGDAGKLFPAKLGTVRDITPTVRHARTGISPDKQPKAGGIPAFGTRAAETIPMPAKKNTGASVGSATGVKDEDGNSKIFIFAGIAIVAGLACFGLWFLLKNKNSAGAEMPPVTSNSPAPVAPPVAAGKSQSFSEIYSGETLRREIQTAISGRDWIKAAELWKKFAAESPDAAGAHKEDFLPLIQAQLAGAFSEKLRTHFAELAPEFSVAGIDSLKKEISAGRGLLEEFKAATPAETRLEISRLDKQIALLEILPKAPPAIVFSDWKSNFAGEKNKRSFAFSDTSLKKFLNRKHTAITFKVSEINNWSEVEGASKNAKTFEIPKESFSEGNALYVNTTGVGKASIYFEIEGGQGGKIRLTHVMPDALTTLDEWLSGKSFLAEFADRAKKGEPPPIKILFVAPGASPRLLSASVDLLENDSAAGTLSVPAWLVGALNRRFGGMQVVLYPKKFADASSKNDYTTPVVSKETVVKAIGLKRAVLETEIATLKKQIDSLKEKLQTADDAEAAEIAKTLNSAGKTLEEKTRRLQVADKEIAGTKNVSGSFVKDYAPWIIGLRDADGHRMPVIILE